MEDIFTQRYSVISSFIVPWILGFGCKTSKEAKVSYSDRGNSIDVYAPADGTLAANRGYSPSWSRPDTYSGFSYNSGTATDAAFSGTSAACPVAAGSNP
jgi:hypothetical protein